MPQPAQPQAADRFVGRSHELAVLRAAYRESAAGDARLVLVAGEPGIGKTELARAFAREAGSDGALVLWGTAWEDGGAPPYWPWLQILRAYGRQAGAAALAEAAGSQAAVLGQFLPELGAAGEQAGSGAWARFALFEAVCTVLDRASQDAPLAVILDDAHAAGRPSVLLLRFAAAARLSRVMLLATYRSAEARLDPDVSDVIAALESAGTPLPLAALSRDEMQLMLPGADAGVLDLVERRGEGNPLFIAQVARLLGHGAATVDEVPVPAGIRQAVRRQVARLGETTAGAAGEGAATVEEVLATAAALGPGIDPVLVAAVLGVPAGLVARLCDDATDIGLLSQGRDVGELYRFRHALIRETLYAELAPQSRVQAHRRIAEALEDKTGRSHSELVEARGCRSPARSLTTWPTRPRPTRSWPSLTRSGSSAVKAGLRPGHTSSSSSRYRRRSGGTSGASRAYHWIPRTGSGCRTGSALTRHSSPSGGICSPRCAAPWTRS